MLAHETTELATGKHLYFDLLIRCLTDQIYIDDPLANYVPFHFNPWTRPWKKKLIRFLQTFLSKQNISLVQPYRSPIQDYASLSAEQIAKYRAKGIDWPSRAHTMVGVPRLKNLQYCIETAIADRVPGDIIETGVWRGGASICARAIVKAYGEPRTVWVADSFKGLPPPDNQYPADAGDSLHAMSEFLAITIEEVKRNFSRYGLLDEGVRFLEGWFKDTLPNAPIQRLAVMRLDGDMYESTIQALEALYPKLSPGGFVIIDDYNLKTCFEAVHDFRARQKITDEIRDIDSAGVYWRHTGS